MRDWLSRLLCCAAISMLPVPPAAAGLNSGAKAHIYWQVGTGPGQSSDCTISPMPQLVVTVTGLVSFKGAEVQLQMHRAVLWHPGDSLTYQPPPPAWHFEPGGCADGNLAMFRGGRGGTYPSAFQSPPSVPGVVTSQQSAYYGPNLAACWNTYGYGLAWFSATGTAGQARDPGAEYAIVAMQFDERGHSYGGSTDCAGDLSNQPVPMMIEPDFLVPCADPGNPRGAVLALLDANNHIDYIPFQFQGIAQGVGWLEASYCFCEAGSVPGTDCGCMVDFCGTTAARILSWGELRQVYR